LEDKDQRDQINKYYNFGTWRSAKEESAANLEVQYLASKADDFSMDQFDGQYHQNKFRRRTDNMVHAYIKFICTR